MVQYVTPVGNTPMGAEATYVIPGQYVESINSFVATLDAAPDTTPDFTPLNDWSGNQSFGYYHFQTFTQAVMSLGPAGPGGQLHGWKTDEPSAPYPGSWANSQAPVLTEWFNGGSFVFWFQDNGGPCPFNIEFHDATPLYATYFNLFTDGSMIFSAPDWYIPAPAGSYVFDGAWHCIAVSWNTDISGRQIWLDGFPLLSPTPPPPPVPSSPPIAGVFVGGSPGNNQGNVAQLSLFDFPLTDGDAAAISTSMGGGIDSYQSLIGAYGPSLWYRFDDNPAGRQGGTTVALIVTNGTDIVGVYPTGIHQAGGTTIRYTWATGIQGVAGDPSAGSVSIPIPELVVPPGYILQTNTYDLLPTDQWFGGALWWDDLGFGGPTVGDVNFQSVVLIPEPKG